MAEHCSLLGTTNITRIAYVTTNYTNVTGHIYSNFDDLEIGGFADGFETGDSSNWSSTLPWSLARGPWKGADGTVSSRPRRATARVYSTPILRENVRLRYVVPIPTWHRRDFRLSSSCIHGGHCGRPAYRNKTVRSPRGATKGRL